MRHSRKSGVKLTVSLVSHGKEVTLILSERLVISERRDLLRVGKSANQKKQPSH